MIDLKKIEQEALEHLTLADSTIRFLCDELKGANEKIQNLETELKKDELSDVRKIHDALHSKFGEYFEQMGALIQENQKLQEERKDLIVNLNMEKTMKEGLADRLTKCIRREQALKEKEK